MKLKVKLKVKLNVKEKVEVNLSVNLKVQQPSKKASTVFSAKSNHFSPEWSSCSVRRDGEKSAAQKALRKKIQKHAKCQTHITTTKMLAEQKEKKLRLQHCTVFRREDN